MAGMAERKLPCVPCADHGVPAGRTLKSCVDDGDQGYGEQGLNGYCMLVYVCCIQPCKYFWYMIGCMSK